MPLIMEYRPSCSFEEQGTNHISNVFIDVELSSSSEEERMAAFSLHCLKCFSAHRAAAAIVGIFAVGCLAYATIGNGAQTNMISKTSPISEVQIKRNPIHYGHENITAAGKTQERRPGAPRGDSLPASKPVVRLASLKQTPDPDHAPENVLTTGNKPKVDGASLKRSPMSAPRQSGGTTVAQSTTKELQQPPVISKSTSTATHQLRDDHEHATSEGHPDGDPADDDNGR